MQHNYMIMHIAKIGNQGLNPDMILVLSYMKDSTAGSWAQNKVKDFSKTRVIPS